MELRLRLPRIRDRHSPFRMAFARTKLGSWWRHIALFGRALPRLRGRPVCKFLIVGCEVRHQDDDLGVFHGERQRSHLRSTITPVLWVPCDTARHLSPRSKVRYRTLSYFVGTIGTLQEVSCRLFRATHRRPRRLLLASSTHQLQEQQLPPLDTCRDRTCIRGPRCCPSIGLRAQACARSLIFSNRSAAEARR
jgi:hypothetical protein